MRPDSLRAVTEDQEEAWISSISIDLNREFRLSLATTVSTGRTLSAVRRLEEEGGSFEFLIAGASNAARTAAALARKGLVAEQVGNLGWRLSADGARTLEELKNNGLEGKVLVLHCLDSGIYFSMDMNGGLSLPLKEKGRYHIPGKLVIASGESLSLIMEQLLPFIKELRTAATVVVTPLPRFMAACCAEHNKCGTAEERYAEKERILKAAWNLKRDIYSQLMKAHAKNFILVSPLEALGVKDSVEGVEAMMRDGVHLCEAAANQLAAHIISRVEEQCVSRKRGPTERAGPLDKRVRRDGGSGAWSARGGGRGGRSGRGGASGGGSGSWGGSRSGGYRSFSGY
jgi:uncharacterized membrane protein YgcG